MFAIDGSNSLLPDQFNQLKQLIKNMIDEYTISEDATRVGVIEYSDEVNVEINLHDFYQAWKLKDAVENIKASNNEGAVTDEVLRKAAEEMFTPEKGLYVIKNLKGKISFLLFQKYSICSEE